jgi:hypothetical protein
MQTMTTLAANDVAHIGGQVALGTRVTVAAALRGQPPAADLLEVVAHAAGRIRGQALRGVARVAVSAVAPETSLVVDLARHAERVVLVTGAARNPLRLLAMGDVQRVLPANSRSRISLRGRALAHVRVRIPRRVRGCPLRHGRRIRAGRVLATPATRRGQENDDECSENDTEE